ncbi:uncharacterized protein LOC132697687 isoform X2 [Cylas formicarius]|uniref:uncharacterized protein LOC132697687 isoform X2 n=1 Tax=Cylas formicarius TaxID=197179 RepID=UPI0029587408|nr:uncharacterized protein LOC132697687 isoform X2 [Cylas formicarius]
MRVKLFWVSVFQKYLAGFATMPNLVLRPLIICGPSGVGKSTLVKKLMEDFPDKFGFTVSHTTRSPRVGEIHGKHYYFTDEETMKKAVDNGEFLEHAVFSGNYYGTSFRAIEEIAKRGRVPVMDIDMQGVKQVKTKIKSWSVFVQPPSLAELRERLVRRKTETETSLERRLAKAMDEIKFGLTRGNFDAVIMNVDLDKAYAELKGFVRENVLSQNFYKGTIDES